MIVLAGVAVVFAAIQFIASCDTWRDPNALPEVPREWRLPLLAAQLVGAAVVCAALGAWIWGVRP